MSQVIFGYLIALLLTRVGFAAINPLEFEKNLGARYSSWSEANVEIDRVEISGVQVFSRQEIDGVIEVVPGDPLERLKVIRTEENLQALYHSHGYEEVRILSRLVRKKNELKNFETLLEFIVDEGRPVKISSIQLNLIGNKNKDSNLKLEKLKSALVNRIPFFVGDILNHDRINDGKRLIQELLVSEEYIGSRVDQIRVTQVPYEAQVKDQEQSVLKWVSVEFQVNMGDRVTFGFRGNTVFTKGYLNSLIDELKIVGLGKDYLSVIRSRIEEEYRSLGYAQVEIKPYTLEGLLHAEKKVTYIIREGPLMKVSSIDFDGNSVFSSKELRGQFFNKASSLVKNKVYSGKDVYKAAELLVEWMKERGYLSAKLITVVTHELPQVKNQKNYSYINVLIYIYEGDQTVVRNWSVSGANLFKSEDVKKILKIQEGAELNLFTLSEGIELLKRSYKDQGYLDFHIINEETASLIRYYQENRFADVFIEMNEGVQYRISRIEIDGLDKTKVSVIWRHLNLKKGQVVSELVLSENERKLRRLGIFSSVEIKALHDPLNLEMKIIRVSFHESDRGLVTVGPGFRNDLGFRLFGQLSYSNLWGLDHTALFNAAMNRRFYRYNFAEAQVQFAYIWPWFGLKDLTFRPSLSGGKTQYINFAADTLTISSVWDKVLASRPNLVGSLGYTLESIRQFNAIDVENNDQLLIGSVTPRLTLDMRDSPLMPTRGFFSTVWFDFAAPSVGSRSDIGYYRIQLRSDYHIPVSQVVQWYFSFRTGFERNFAPSEVVGQNGQLQNSSIPLIKQFALGGIGSLRGFQEQELNFQYLSIRNSLSYVNYRTQLDFPFTGALKFGLFVDAATLLVNRYSFGGLRYGTGFGFHYQTPLGPVNFDWGFKIDPPQGSDAYVVHFSVGMI